MQFSEAQSSVDAGEKLTNLVYQSKRYAEDYSPMCVYIPSSEILFKMMRACIGTYAIEDLWIYNEKYTHVCREHGHHGMTDAKGCTNHQIHAQIDPTDD